MTIDLNTILDLASKVISAASVITAVTPTPPQSSVWGRLYRCIETAALLIGHARPAPANNNNQHTP